ncbi:MAG: oligosaccharide flippase family protein [Sharpea porci]|uniref:lipopolysaccharide biosynthesis protein n=1 Tax=Sharpea porci TaxID=2652286 RepID=UPI002409B835|nr:MULTISPECIES: oligosaccharide flippase family protein [Coprobacillaceae]MDD6594901.1 oligosaccharide flippase family protein [Catenibacterium mitsuokai]MDD6710488.1 oligosaccharide flippase family protein [Sharpea porci]
MENNEIEYKGNVVARNSILSLIYKAFSMGLSLISAPLLLSILGDYKYGIYSSALSIVSWIYYFDLGIGNGLRFKLTGYLAKNDEEGSQKTVTIAYVLVSLIMLIAIIIVVCFLSIFDADKFFKIKTINENINMILIISFALAGVNFILSLVNNVLLAVQESSKVNFFSLLAQVFFIVGLFFYKKWGISLILLVSIAEACSQSIKNIIETIYVYKKYPKLKPSRKVIDFSYSNGIMSFGIKMFALQMSALVLNSTDNLLILKLFGASSVTPYSFLYKYFGMINNVYVILIGPLMSAYTMAFAKKDYIWIKSTFKKSMLLYALVFIGTIVALFVFKPFSRIWLQKDLNFDNSLIVLTAIYFLMLMFSHNFSSFVNGIGVVNETTLAVVIQAIINIPASIFFAKYCAMGVNGIIMGSIVSMIISNIVYPYITIREFKKMIK